MIHALEIEGGGDRWAVSDPTVGLTAYGSSRPAAITRLKEMYIAWVDEYALRLYRDAG